MNKHKGFTLIELVVVIVVVGILAAISIASYSMMRSNAMDTKIKAAVKAAGEAVTLYETQTKQRLGGRGEFNTANSVDSLVPQYLNQDYRQGLNSRHATHPDRILRWYPCHDGNQGIVVYASLNNPKDSDTTNFLNQRARCRHGDVEAPTEGSVVFNYAQTF